MERVKKNIEFIKQTELINNNDISKEEFSFYDIINYKKVFGEVSDLIDENRTNDVYRNVCNIYTTLEDCIGENMLYIYNNIAEEIENLDRLLKKFELKKKFLNDENKFEEYKLYCRLFGYLEKIIICIVHERRDLKYIDRLLRELARILKNHFDID